MKINEVEERVGITKRNIRFYEKEGLLTPQRNSDNGYRDYGEEEVEVLRKIKLLRKLDVPLEEIRRLQHGALTLDDVLRRHVIQLRREEHNLATMGALCQRLADAQAPASYQFLRQGYFCVDNKDSQPGHLVFNRSVSLKDSFKPGK